MLCFTPHLQDFSVLYWVDRVVHMLIFTMVSYFLRWTLLKLFSSFPDEQSQQKVQQLGRITCAVINISHEVKCTLLWGFWIYNVSRRILERVFVGSIVNIRNECLFFWVHGEWIVARNKQIAREPLRYELRFIPPWTQEKGTHSLKQCVTNLTRHLKFTMVDLDRPLLRILPFFCIFPEYRIVRL